MSDYATYLGNLTNSIANLPDTEIKFVFFLASDLTSPKVMTKLKRFKVDKKDCYIVNGYSKNYWYVYRDTVLKYITNPPVPYKATSFFQTRIIAKNSSGDTNQGDHVDFSIKKARTPSGTRIESHLTEYTDDGYFNFSRSTREFDFIFDPSYFGSFNKFVEDMPFTTPNGVALGLRIDNVFNDVTACKIVYRLCEAALSPGFMLSSSGKNRVHHVYKGKKHKVCIGKRGGKYIVHDDKKIYIQKAGNLIDKVTYYSNEFVDFLRDTLLVRVVALNDDLSTIQVIFDEGNELSPNGSKYILLMYDFVENYRNLFYVETQMALSAYLVHLNTQNSTSHTPLTAQAKGVTEQDMSYHRQYFSMINSLNTTMKHQPMEVF